MNENAVVYSVTVGTEIGDFDFNYIALINRNLNLLGVAVYTNTIKKIKNKNSIQAMRSPVRFYLSLLMQSRFTTSLFQHKLGKIDFTARLSRALMKKSVLLTEIYTAVIDLF